MIEQEMFEDSSKASEIKDNLEKISSTTAENNKKKKVRTQKIVAEKTEQITLFAVVVSYC
jgi:hypothetical protein